MTTTTRQLPTILVADDDEAFRSLARMTLADAGFHVLEAADGKSACEVATRELPSALLVDISMPHKDGFDVCAELRQNPAFMDIPIIIMTMRDDEEAVEHAYEVGATDFIPKVVDWSLLILRMRHYVRSGEIRRGLRSSERKNQAFIQAIPDSMLVVRRDGTLLSHHRGQSGSHLIDDNVKVGGNVFADLPGTLSDLWRAQVARVLSDNEVESGEHKASRNGRKHYYETRVVPYAEDTVLFIIRDVSDQRQAVAKVQRLAFFDTLTGLPNRQSFLIELADAIRSAAEDSSCVAVLYINLDNFKIVNDSLGHTAGDNLLKHISRRLAQSVRADDFIARDEGNTAKMSVARLGGDEFTLILKGLDDVAEADAVAERVVTVLKEPADIDGHRFVVTPSVGIAVYPADGEDVETLTKNANTALHHAKAAGRDRVTHFSGTMSIRSLERLDIEDSLRRAIDSDQLDLHFQPKVNLLSQEVVGLEALLRWSHPERGAISPAKFVPIAEESGLIIPLSNWVLHEACRQLAVWNSGALASVPVAINLSAHQFRTVDLHRQILDALTAHGLAPERLELELTEGALMRDVDETVATLGHLKNAGLKIAVDDFGTGYSSMSYLKKFPIDALKVDRSFVYEIDSSDDSHSICKAIVALAHGLGMKVIAEGVETHEQMQMLRMMDCDQVQGFFIAKPMPAREVESFCELQARKRIGQLPLSDYSMGRQ